MPSSCRKNISNTDRLIKSERRALTQAASEHGQMAGTLGGGKKTILYTFNNQTHSQYHPLLLGE